MSATTKTARTAKSAPAGATTAYPVAALPATGTQFRHNSGATGTAQATAYQQATRALGNWARGGANAPLVHALVHLGWCTGSGARSTVRAANSAAWKHAASVLTVGTPAAPQVVSTLEALAAAGAPAPALATVWATFTATA